jgi:hypothetical protein
MGYQSIAALTAAAVSVVVTLTLFFYSTRFESKHQSDKHDEH